MTTIDRETFTDIALQLAVSAGEKIMEIYETDFDVSTKQDASPVTEADVAAEAIILAGLRDAFPDLPIVAEEEAAAGNIPDIGNVFVLVDPLDGTREFLNRNGAFTVNIGLIENGSPVAGVVHAPALLRTFGGSVGKGAFEISSNERTTIAVRAANPCLLYTSPSPRDLSTSRMPSSA